MELFVNTAGQPGNEEGFVVQIKADDVDPPYELQPATKVRLVAEYDSREDRLGASSLIVSWLCANACVGTDLRRRKLHFL